MLCTPRRYAEHHGDTVRKFSDARNSTRPDRALVGRGRGAVDVSECRGEVAMTTEPEIEGQVGQIVVIGEHLEGSRQAQPKLVPVQRHVFDAFEDLSQVHR